VIWIRGLLSREMEMKKEEEKNADEVPLPTCVVQSHDERGGGMKS
jgi:hypothetical protein